MIRLIMKGNTIFAFGSLLIFLSLCQFCFAGFDVSNYYTITPTTGPREGTSCYLLGTSPTKMFSVDVYYRATGGAIVFTQEYHVTSATEDNTSAVLVNTTIGVSRSADIKATYVRALHTVVAPCQAQLYNSMCVYSKDKVMNLNDTSRVEVNTIVASWDTAILLQQGTTTIKETVNSGPLYYALQFESPVHSYRLEINSTTAEYEPFPFSSLCLTQDSCNRTRENCILFLEPNERSFFSLSLDIPDPAIPYYLIFDISGGGDVNLAITTTQQICTVSCEVSPTPDPSPDSSSEPTPTPITIPTTTGGDAAEFTTTSMSGSQTTPGSASVSNWAQSHWFFIVLSVGLATVVFTAVGIRVSAWYKVRFPAHLHEPVNLEEVQTGTT